jgi:hypothetical protein
LIDVPKDRAGESEAFWAEALGVSTEPEPGQPQYVVLKDALPGFVTAIQAVDDEPRYHFDIETDDVPAEVARLVGLGAVEVSSWEGCHTLRAPGGHLLCVIPLHSSPEEFAAAARTWP